MTHHAPSLIGASALIALSLVLTGCAREATPSTPADAPTPSSPAPFEAPLLERVEVGEVTSTAPEAGPAAIESLRRALYGVAERLDDDQGLTRDLVLNAAVTRLSRTPADGGVTVRVTVSLSIRDAQQGQIVVVLESTAQSTGPRPTDDAERDDFDGEVIAGTVEELWGRLRERVGEL